ncbi:Phosphate ABC transporter, periplasmic phosphate-binding protein PstS (TC 3.A.1.7.1) [hydrothermal vent metagenome]|uniref:Phosphate ABC transporter, periplasmic phosphate-binding protein PstS (TC 3.A.1.7.1) n=1 Tax=hydrothermal vent metagenome TaxID=652676 RepID=A0A3B0YIA2_9ZZZZ
MEKGNGMGRFLTLMMLVLVSPIMAQPVLAEQQPALHWVGCGISKKAYLVNLAKAYEKKTGIVIDVQGGGATRGIRDVASMSADLGGSCRRRIRGVAEESGIVQVPVAWDALVAIVHKDSPVNNISLEDLRKVYLGQITNWKQLGGEDMPINLLVRKGKISGVGSTTRKLLFDNYDQEFVASELFDSSGPLEKKVESEPGTFAISGISSARKRNVKILDLNGKSPTYENVSTGAYLLYRPLYLVYNKDSEHANMAREFIRFAGSKEGRNVIRANNTVPYLEGLNLLRVKLNESKMAREGGGLH